MIKAARPDFRLPALAALFGAGLVLMLLPIPWFVEGWGYYLLLAAVVGWMAVAGFVVWASRRRWPLAVTLGPLALLLLWMIIDIQQWVVRGEFFFW